MYLLLFNLRIRSNKYNELDLSFLQNENGRTSEPRPRMGHGVNLGVTYDYDFIVAQYPYTCEILLRPSM